MTHVSFDIEEMTPTKGTRRPKSTERGYAMSEEAWIERLAELKSLLAVCPSDIRVRCELALLLEQLNQHEEALLNWKAVLEYDSNNLMAREGVTRSRNRSSCGLQSFE